MSKGAPPLGGQFLCLKNLAEYWGVPPPHPPFTDIAPIWPWKGSLSNTVWWIFSVKGAGGLPPKSDKSVSPKILSAKGGREYPPTSLFCYLKKQVFLIQKEYFGFSTCYWWVPLIPLRIWVDLQMKLWLLLEPEIAPNYTVTCSVSTAHILMTSKYDTLTHVKPHEKQVDEHHFQPWCFIAEKLFSWMYWSHCFFWMDFISGS